MLCNEKHIKNPIPSEDWKCPKCGANNESFAIWDTNYDPECDGEHPDDVASCTACGYSATVATVTRNYWKKKNIVYVKCPHCHGTGELPKKLESVHETDIDTEG